ncbi:hypothetical protein DGG96_04625 [Legionella qingyii]|uniref:Uncharacterized protein n=1 Tax=Legionella qingyii TaxID=2184757 RepID=A0A317U689_9GAMM|nr:hypothetical protein [Legionella qingyii]PWY56698.1 hypothetical protein DGG96_04625 [Legionella qingyii]RUR23749.1 hypothetical protein ELY20_06990 [Legionella qingyii]RUR26331.1 hypothetical protein ELY16_07850 [Legionella qingyii]
MWFFAAIIPLVVLKNEHAIERLIDFDIAALLNSKLYSTLVNKHEYIFNQIEKVKAYKNQTKELTNTPQNPAA